MISCGQACPYNTPNGCKVKEYNGICPLTNMALADMEAVKAAKPQTNADRYRAMSDEELAEFKMGEHCPPGKRFPDCATLKPCKECWLEYLRQPVKDGEGDG